MQCAGPVSCSETRNCLGTLCEPGHFLCSGLLLCQHHWVKEHSSAYCLQHLLWHCSLSPFPCWFQWLPPPLPTIVILQDLMSDTSHSFSLPTSFLILHTLPDDVQHTDFLLLLDTELEGHFSPSACLMWPITQLQSLSPSQVFFFLQSRLPWIHESCQG